MNPEGIRYSRWLSIFLLTGAFLISSELPLLAKPQQSSASSSNPSSSSSNQPASSEEKQKDPLPDTPQVQPAQAPENPQSANAPSGAAGAKAANVKGAPVAQPVGAAVAPPRQHGHRSLLIKIGLVAGAGVALGTAVALAERSPARPPGAPSSNHP